MGMMYPYQNARRYAIGLPGSPFVGISSSIRVPLPEPAVNTNVPPMLRMRFSMFCSPFPGEVTEADSNPWPSS
jgi:hypothetical protein